MKNQARMLWLLPVMMLLFAMIALSGCGGGNPAAPSGTTGGTGGGSTVPAAPTGVTATAGNAQNTISWTAVTGATSYNIYGGTASSSAIKGGTKIASASASPYIHANLANGTTYYYVVTAINAAGESPASNIASGTASPTTPPGPPAGVTATASGSAQINVNWTLVSGATGYNIYRSNAPNVAINAQNKITGTPVAAGPYGNTGLAAGTTYYYKVTAINANGESTCSTEVSATTASTPQAPAAPTGVTATASGSAQINVNWTNVNGATGYNIYRGTAPNVAIAAGNKVNTQGPVAAGPFGNNGLSAGTTYYYKVTAVNANGESAGSAEVSATTASAPQAPAAPTGVTATASGSAQINVDWTLVNGATGYNIYRSTAPNVAITQSNLANTTGPVAAGPYGNTGLTAGTTYYYKVTAVNANGESAGSTEANATTATAPTAPSAPTVVTATASGSAQINVDWFWVNGATGYNIYRSTAPNVAITAANKITANPAAAGPYGNTGLAAGTTYYYKVTAVNANGESTGSPEASATTALAAPTGVVATAGDGQVAMNWNGVAGASSYKVYRSTTPGVTPQNAPNANIFAGTYTPPYTIFGLTNGTKYYFVVTVVDANNAESAPSPEVNATPVAVPTGVTATAISSTRIDINWTNAAGATGYNLYRATAPNVAITAANKVTAAPVAGGPFANTGLTAGTTYYYKVTAVYPNAMEAASTEVSTATLSPPAAPTVTATADHSQNIITWNAVSGATSYNIYWSTATGVTKANGTPITGVTSPYFHGGLTSGAPYYYVVTAVNANGESVESTQATATPTPNGTLGVDWTTRGKDSFYYVSGAMAFGNGKYVALCQAPYAYFGASADVMLSTSPDGVTWTPKIIGTATTGISGKVVSGNGVFVADVSSNIYSSADGGVNWSMPALGTANSTFFGLSFSNGKFYIFERNAATNVTTLYVSTDGAAWTPYTGAGIPPVANGGAGVSFGNGTYVLYNSFGGTYTDIYTSVDGINWTRQPGAGAGAGGISFGNGKFLLIAGNNIYTSVDGVTWTTQPLPNNTIIHDVIFANGQFIMAGNDYNGSTWPPVILTSPDGVTWTRRTVADASVAGTTSLQAISFGINQFVATDGSHFVTSP